MNPPLLTGLLIFLSSLAISADDDPLAVWSSGVEIAPVSDAAGRHSIHTYYLTNPERPDGKKVLYFASTHPAAYIGEIRVIDRTTRKETVLAENVHTEDAHRVACQQWLAGGRLVAFHEVVDKKWRVVIVDVESGEKTVVAENRQVGIGRPGGDLLPIYGCHWNPGPDRDLYVWDARTGEIRTALSITAVEAQHAEWMTKEFAGKPVSIFFPVLSPDLKRVFFKLAAGNGGDDYMAKNASHRQGLVCFDLETATMKWFRAQWGHPGWYPDSRHLFEMGNVIFDTEEPSTRYTKLKGVPALRGSHPSVSPDGRLMVTDGMMESIGGAPGEWGIVVADMRGGKWTVIDRFDQTKGAKSWRRNDPHPVFSADGKRIYYNVSDGEFTRLLVAEAGTEAAAAR
ncbi:MAG TPA: hypothetical protein PK529_12115 [Verrucomicrobiales bacterium]|nr:hypothetical protein [Verrucomicrobiales bacterium]